MSKFFTYEERLELQKHLKESLSFKEISRRLDKNPTTISREVSKNRSEVATGYPGFPYNVCKNRFNCRKKDICGNDCENLGRCTLLKSIYDAEHAHIKFSETISEARSGLCVSEDEIARLNAIISPLVQKGQSVHQIYVTHEDEIMCSEKTIYNYIDACLFDVRNIDLPRKVKFRERYKKPEFKVDKGCRIGRNYENFHTYLNRNSDISVVQMDSVIGTKGGKCILTIHFVESSLMLAFLRDANTSQSVIDVFNMLEKDLGEEIFQKLFPVILTDNGSEFSNPRAIEYRPEPRFGLRTKVFYCDAGSPFQKGSIEVNHELIRRVIPKGTSLNNLIQEDINLMMNHINSYKRKKLNNRSPYETFSFYHGEDVLTKLRCSPVVDSDIMLKSALLKK